MKPANRGLMFGVAAIVIVCAFMEGWFTGHARVSIGLWSVEGTRWDDIRAAQEDLYVAGYVAFAASLVGAVLLMVAALRGGSVARSVRVAFGIALVAMAYFMVRGLLLEAIPGASMSWAFVVGPVATYLGYRFAR